MRLKGKLSAALPESIDDILQKNKPLFLDVPFINLPNYPIGSFLWLDVVGSDREKVELDSFTIDHYHGSNTAGTQVSISYNGLTSSLLAFLKLCCIYDDHGKSGTYVYRGRIDFSYC